MLLRNLILGNFRNYREQELKLNRNFNFIYGNNGEGKTNILEAVSFISYGKSFINSPESDCVRFGCSEFTVRGTYESEAGILNEFELDYNKDLKKKYYKLNREKVGRFSSEIFGKFPVVFFSPHSLNLTYGNPSDRRKFFDILIAQTSRLYLDMLKNYARLIKQKNALLKPAGASANGYRKTADFHLLLRSMNEKLSELSAGIIFRRLNFLKEFIPYLKVNMKFLCECGDIPLVDYYCTAEEINLLKDFSLDSVKSEFENSLEKKYDEEITRGISLVGPHRDDFIFSLEKYENSISDRVNFEIRNFASQGEHKTFVVALKLSEYHFLKDKLGSTPILLLDDVLSELDSKRVSGIISHLKDYGQIFLTATDLSYSESLKKFYSGESISYFYVKGGILEKK